MIKTIIVDDEYNIVTGLKYLVPWNDLGFEVPQTFTDSTEALIYLKSENCDLIITDIRMPIMNGLELIHQIKFYKPQIKSIIISSYSDFEYMKTAIIEGARNYLLKPVHEDELINALIKLKTEIINGTAENSVQHSFAVQTSNAVSLIAEQWSRKITEAVFALDSEQISDTVIKMNFEIRKKIQTEADFATVVYSYNRILNLLAETMEKRLLISPVNYQELVQESGHCNLSLLADVFVDEILNIIQVAGAMSIKEFNFSDTIDRIKFYILLHYQEPLTLNSVAERFYFNPSYLSYLFSKTGVNFLTYLNAFRLRQSVCLLKNTDIPINSIAVQSGFSSEKLFYRIFKKHYGCTPSQFREEK